MTVLFFDNALLPQGWVRDVRLTLEDGRIATVETGVALQLGDDHHHIGLPGMSNLHSHAFQRAMAGLTEARGATADSFWTWRELMYRFVQRITPDEVEAIAAQVYVEMLEAGYTRVGEFHYVHHDAGGQPYADIAELAHRVIAASQSTGMALTLLPVFYAHAGFGGRAPEPLQRRFINTPDQFARLIEQCRTALESVPGAVLGIAPHSLRAATPDELGGIVPLAQDGPIHIHVAEQTREVEDCVAWSGQRPVEWLLDHAPVDRRWCLIHATHTNAHELRGMAERSVVAGLCPITEANLGDGTFDLPTFLQHGGGFGVGSDSNVLIGLADELRQLEYSQRLARRARSVTAVDYAPSTGRALFDRALAGGAQALGVDRVGLVQGAVADIVSLDADHLALAGRSGDALLDSWIFAASRAGVVDCVWTAGRKVVTNGRHHQRDAAEARFRRALHNLLSA
ncbi:formimidoylglutamate deiminase [Rhodopseudomonas sp. B29]|uniref:formimidoylglutamate deiminase n=1 Tax=Rhodopseudomonas sp. B29 TaxID=95607 RepID=UPI000346B317|nr:formimidoylglutamate deiminase [Rhodopseudomonas sp. B29]